MPIPTPGSVVTSLVPTTMNVRYASSALDAAGGWFGPNRPMNPVAPPDVAGRAFDYPPGYNLLISPRAYEPISFADLRALADSYDILRIVIETRKDQMKRQPWKFVPKVGVDGKPMAKNDDPRIKELTDFFQRPDGEHDWDVWLGELLEDMFVLDAATLWRGRTRGGKFIGLLPVDGATIKRVITQGGRTPAPPDPAYQQVLKGMPAVNYTTEDLHYLPRNVRIHKIYGYGPVEQVIMTVNIALRRELFQLSYYTEGNMPEALVGTPDQWTPDQISRFQGAFDAMLAGNQSMRRRIKFVPGGVAKTFIPTKEPDLTGKMDEWLARVVCFCFSISPQPFVQMMNRATSDSAHESATEEGLEPTMFWVSGAINRSVRMDFGYDDIVHAWEDDREVDPKAQMEVQTGYMKVGARTINEVREVIGDPPVEGGEVPRVLTPSGYVPLDSFEAQQELQRQKMEADANRPQVVADPNAKPGKPAPKDTGEVDKSALPFVKLASTRVAMTHDTRKVASGIKKLRTTMAKFLASSGRAATAAAVEKYRELVKADEDEIARAATDEIDWRVVVNPTTSQLEAAMKAGGYHALASLGVEEQGTYLDQVNETAETFARDRAAELVGMKYNALGELIPNPDAEWRIDETTRDVIRDATREAIQEGLSAAELADRIEETGAFSSDRAEMIARTEIIRANNEGHMAAFRASGVVEMKAWTTAGDDDVDEEVCGANEDEGPIPLDASFQSGDEAPPGHPNCRCVLVAVISSVEDEEGADAD